MNNLATDAENAPEGSPERAPKGFRSPLFRRLRTVRDMALVLGAWMGSWAFVILMVKGLTGLF